VHDANWLDHPEDFTFISKLITNFLVTLACRKSTTIITDSEFSKQRLTTHLPWARQKIRVVKPFVPQEIYTPPYEELPRTLRGKKFVFCVSAHYPHKRIPYLLQVWKQVHRLQPDAYLVVVGQNGKDHPIVMELLANQESVIYYPKVSFPLLKSLYHFAHLFVHPSIYEGFGYPVYEASANRCPVIVGNRSLYPDDLAKEFEEFTFDEATDAKKVAGYLDTAKKPIKVPLLTAINALKPLLQLYAN